MEQLQKAQEVKEKKSSSDLAVDNESPYFSVDPTPAMPSSTPIGELQSIIMDEGRPMFEVGQRVHAYKPGVDMGVTTVC